MIPLYCSTGTFLGRTNGRDWRYIPLTGPKLDCDGLELLVFSDWYGQEKELLAALKSSGLRFPTLHADKNIGDLISSGETAEAVERYRRCCDIAEGVGAGLTVIHLWGPPVSDGEFSRNLAACGKLLEIAGEYGVTAAIENIPCSVSDPLTRLAELAEAYPAVRFTFDTRMAAFHGQFEAICAGKYDALLARAAHAHYSDYVGGVKEWERLREIKQPGEGSADPAAFGRWLARSGYRGAVTMESPSITADGGDIDRINASLKKLRAALDIDKTDAKI